MTATKIRKPTFKHVESELYHFHDTLREIDEIRKNIMHCRTNEDENTGGGRGSYISDPTAQIGTRLATHKKLNRLEEIADAINRVYEALPPERQKLIKLKYWTRPQLKTWDGIALELNVSRRQAMRWRDEIVTAVSEIVGWR